jgi:DNA polymerase III subunit beta
VIKGSLTAKPQVFAAAVGWAAKFVTAKPVVPVHGGIMLDVESGTLTVVSYSENVSTRAVLPVDGDAAGRAVVSGRLLASIVATLADKPVTLEGADDHLKLTAGTFRATLPTMAEDEYPDPPAVPAPIGAVSGDAFAAMVQRVAVAASDDLSNRVALAGLHLAIGPDWITALATDSYRAASDMVPFAPRDKLMVAETALALAETMTDAAQAFTGPDDITIGLDGNNLSLTSPTRSLTVRLLGEKYDAEGLGKFFAVEHPQHVPVTRADLIGPLKRAELVRGGAKDKQGPIRLDLTEGAVTVVAKADDLAQDSDETIEADYTGPEHSLAFNPRYLTEALHSAPGDVVDMAFTTERLAQVVFTAPGDDTWRHVLVPIKLL